MTSHAPTSPVDIVYLVHDLKTGGTQRQLEELLARLPENFRPQIICLGEPRQIGARLQERGIPVHAFHCHNFCSFHGMRTLWRVMRLLRHIRPHLLQAFLPTQNLFAPFLGKLCGARVITCRRDTGFNLTPRMRWCLRRVANRADTCTANSSAVAQAASQAEGIPLQKIRIIPNAVHVPSPLSQDERLAHRKELDIPADATLIIQVATLTPVKNHATSLHAAKILHGRGVAFRWLMVGDGPLRDTLEEDAKQAGLSAVVRFCGPRDDVMALLQCADISVLTSRSEGFPNAILESMAAGCAVVATDLPAVRDMIENSVHGLTVPVGDAQAVADAIDELIRNPERRASMATQAHACAAEAFSWDRCVEATVKLYYEVLEGSE